VQVFVVRAGMADEVEAAFTTLVQREARAVIVGSDTFFTSRRGQISLLAARRSLPAMWVTRIEVEAGGLMSYSRRLSSGRGLCGTSSQGCQASQSAGATSDQVRFGDQSSDRQGARPRCPADAARPRRRGDRMTRRSPRAGGAAKRGPASLGRNLARIVPLQCSCTFARRPMGWQ
jgi:hypothetical protein